jgi:threonine dehydratase
MILPTTLDVYNARRRLQPRLQATPLRRSSWQSDRAGAEVFVKLEALNLTGSFKIRGAFNALLALMETSPQPPLVVTASAGNHGRGIALAAEQLGLRSVVFTPNDAPATKKEGIRRHGARLVDDNADYNVAERRARDFADAEGGVYLSPYNHRDVIAGAGTIGLEIIEALPKCDVVVAPLGGGGLAAGIGLALKAVAPHVVFVGVEVEASSPFTKSLEAGRIVEITPQPSLADGLTGNLEPEAITFSLVRDSIERVVLVSEEQLAEAMRGFGEDEHLIVEGAGAAAAAAVAAGKADVQGKTVAVLVTGGNVDLEKWIGAVRQKLGTET